MKSLILCKEDRNKYLGIARVLNYLGITTSVPERTFPKEKYDIVISDEFCLPIAKQAGGALVGPEHGVSWAMDTLLHGRDLIKTDVTYIGDWDMVAQKTIPKLSGLGNKFSFKMYGPSQLNSVEGWFWNETSRNAAKNTKISFLLDSPEEFYWDSVFYCKPIVDGIGLENPEEVCSRVLENYSVYQQRAKELRDETWSQNTYFHEVDKIFQRINEKFIIPLREELFLKYEQNRFHSR